MALHVRCSECNARLNAPDSAAGKTVRCPKCKTMTTVPNPAWEIVDDEPVAPYEIDEDVESKGDARPKTGKIKAGNLIVLTLIVLLVAFIICAVVSVGLGGRPLLFIILAVFWVLGPAYLSSELGRHRSIGSAS